MMRARGLWSLFAGGVTLVLSTAAATASPLDEFYKDKTVSLIVGGSEGGGYDTLAREIGRYIGRHIPGSPTIVVRDMPGAGGLVATNYLFNNAEQDGTVIGLVENSTPLAPLLGTGEARYDPVKFNWLGTPSVETGIVLVWHTAPVNSVDDLKSQVTTMGASGTHSTQAFYTRLLNATLGTKMRVVNGYKGLNDTFLAMERGEIEGSPSVFYSALTSTRPEWLPQHLARAIIQYGPERLGELRDTPFAPDLVTNADDKLLLQAAFAPLALGRPLVMPPNIPPDRVAAMRQALAETLTDAGFLAEAQKMGLLVNAPRTGEQLQRVMIDAYATPSRVIDRLRVLDQAADR